MFSCSHYRRGLPFARFVAPTAPSMRLGTEGVWVDYIGRDSTQTSRGCFSFGGLRLCRLTCNSQEVLSRAMLWQRRSCHRMNDSCQVLFITQTRAVFKFLRGLHCSASALHGSTPPSLCKAGLSKGDVFGFPSQGPSLQTVDVLLSHS